MFFMGRLRLVECAFWLHIPQLAGMRCHDMSAEIQDEHKHHRDEYDTLLL